jgi:hypothetical protein
MTRDLDDRAYALLKDLKAAHVEFHCECGVLRPNRTETVSNSTVDYPNPALCPASHWSMPFWAGQPVFGSGRLCAREGWVDVVLTFCNA